ncbi:MAG: Rpn family recombination-promoting nuclease/putative transposase [Thermoanaerobaculia bacterium]
MATQHDKIFKQLLRVFLEGFLRLVAPQALERLDLSAPGLLDKELFAGGPHGRRRELDLLVRVRTRDGRRPLLIHVEIEARASRGMAERLWRYRSQIQARYDARMLTIAFCLKRGPGVNLETWESSLGADFPEPRYVSFGLAGCRAADYLDRPSLGPRGPLGPRPLEPRRAEDGLPAPDRRAERPARPPTYLSTAWKII